MSTPSWIGRKLSGRYEIESLLGQGGMSAVYKADDPNLRRTVAVKLIHTHLSSDPQFISRFEEEAASVAQLRHPNIIQVYDFSSDEDTYYMILEFVTGETLEQQLERLNKGNRRMANKEAIKSIASICDALHYAHERGLIHRDIKPANIMINLQGQAILMDFGVAKMIGGKQHTATGAVVGTALYMSPEIIQGQQADRRVDIYALGVTLYEALTGEPPFMADSAMSTMMMHVNDPVPDLHKLNPDVPDGLVAVIKKALAKNKDERYRTAEEFGEALRGVDLSGKVSLSSGAQTVKASSIESTMLENQTLEPSPESTMIEQPESLAPAGSGATMIETPAPAQAASQTPPPTATPPTPPTPARRPAAQPSGGGKKGLFSNPMVIGGIVVGVILIAVVGFFGVRALAPSADPTETATLAPTLPATSPPATAPVEVVVPTETPSPPPTEVVDPPTATPTDPVGPYVRINSIELDGSNYVVTYETFGYTEAIPGEHIHFFFNNVLPEQAGVGGSGPWYVWGGPRPFSGYTTADRPGSADQICALVANQNHTIQLDSGNCVALPEG